MKEEIQFAYQVRQILNLGTENLERETVLRLAAARQKAMQHQKVAGLHFAGIGHVSLEMFPSYARAILAGLAILIGVVSTYMWNQFEEAAENEEIDSALLADDLPPTAYLDRGFQVWLKREQQSQE